MSDVTVTPSATSKLTGILKPGSYEIEKGHFSRYFSLNWWQLIVVAGIAISGIAAIANTYDAITGVDKDIEGCENVSNLRKKLEAKFIIIIVLSCLAVVGGIILAWLLRSGTNQRKLLTMGLTTGGILGILYALTIRFRGTSNMVKLGISWVSLLAFVLLGFFINTSGE